MDVVELELDVKAKLDGEYCKNLSFSFDVKCFLMTIFSVLRHDGVVRGVQEVSAMNVFGGYVLRGLIVENIS